jgi:hypothetical protein
VPLHLDQNPARVHGAVTGAGFVQRRKRVGNAQRITDRIDRLLLADVVEALGQGQARQALGDPVALVAELEHLEQPREVHVAHVFGALERGRDVRRQLEDDDGRVAVHSAGGERVRRAV